MTLSEELTWRGFVNQTTLKDNSALDNNLISFYWGVDPSADSMTIGNLAAAMMVRHFINHGHKAVLLVGGATGLIGDPDGKNKERELKSMEEIAGNKAGIVKQYQQIFEGNKFEVVDNYDWFKAINYLEFLREVGKHVPIRQMIGREFVQSRLGDEGAGISYAEFSYSLIQGYDFLHLYREKGVTLQVCGADQWGNSIAGVDLIRRITGKEVHVWSTPLIINKATGVKFGKSESGAIWLDPNRTTPTQFYQFWINSDDGGLEDYLKIYTFLTNEEVSQVVAEYQGNPAARSGQRRLAKEVTNIVHGSEATRLAERVTDVLTGKVSVGELDDATRTALQTEISVVQVTHQASVAETLVRSGLVSSNTEAKRLLSSNAISVNGAKISNENFEELDFIDGRLLLKRGKAYKDSALVELV